MIFLTLDELITLYPTGFVHPSIQDNQIYFVVHIDNGWFHIPHEDLSEGEKKLLLALYKDRTFNHPLKKHPWYDYLINQIPLSSFDGQYRMIQVHLKNESPLSKEWLTHFSDLFNQIEDAFFLDEQHAILIEKQSAITYKKEDIKGMLLTLESDFLIKASLFIGAFNEPLPVLLPLFQEEMSLFKTYQHKKELIHSFQDVALDYLTADAIQCSPIMQSLKDTLNIDDELKHIIKTLWKKQGNITSTSKELYIHRNTLQYRIDKFYERSGFSLKDMNDLTLCYLLVEKN